MQTTNKTLVDLETKFWDAIVHQDTDAAIDLLGEPAVMVNAHGAVKFDHAGYREMAEKGSMVVTDFELSDVDVVFPNDTTAILTYRVKQSLETRGTGQTSVEEMNDASTWVRSGQGWRCVMHTETPVDAQARH